MKPNPRVDGGSAPNLACGLYVTQVGMAIPLVLWMVAALTLTLSGVVYLARDSVSMSELRLQEAQAYAIARGAAQLAVRDYQSRQALENEGAASEFEAAPRNIYQFNGIKVETTIFPANGFVPIGEQNPEVWVKLLSRVGGMDVNSAARLSQRIVDARLSGGAGGSSGGGLTFDKIYEERVSGPARTSRTGHIEALLGVSGMTRTVYDRLVRVISPFDVGGFNEARAPEGLKGLLDLGGASSDQEPAQDFLAGSGYWCVDVSMEFSPSDNFKQRVWVNAVDASQGGGAELVRVEAPYQSEKNG